MKPLMTVEKDDKAIPKGVMIRNLETEYKYLFSLEYTTAETARQNAERSRRILREWKILTGWGLTS